MTQYDTLNAKLFNSQLNEIKSGIKNDTELTLKLSPNVVGDCSDENNFPHKLLLTNTRVSKLRKDFVNNSSANIRLLHKTGESGGFLGRLLWWFLKIALPLMTNVPKSLGKSVLIPLGSTVAAAAVTEAAIHKKMFGSGRMRILTESYNFYKRNELYHESSQISWRILFIDKRH